MKTCNSKYEALHKCARLRGTENNNMGCIHPLKAHQTANKCQLSVICNMPLKAEDGEHFYTVTT